MRGARQLTFRLVTGLLVALTSVMLALPGGATGAGRVPAAAAAVPKGFVGMNAGGPLFFSSVNLAGQLKKMAGVGVQQIRVEFSWGNAQPYATCSQAPGGCTGHPYVAGPGGVPTDFTRTDNIVLLAARAHLRVFPVVEFSPGWDASAKNHAQPAHDKPYGQYLTALVRRYGSNGTFWSSHPSVPKYPITEWQIWNEPDLTPYWSQPFAPSYVGLLKVAHSAIKKVDSKAEVLVGSLTNYGWRDLASIYKVHGSRNYFDGVTADVYTAQPSGVITILSYYRKVMAQHGDAGKPLIPSEVGWPSDRSVANAHTPFSTTEKGQAKKLSKLLPLLAQNRVKLKLPAFFYFTWLSTDKGGPRTWYFYSGLLQYNSNHTITPKPAYAAFKQTVRKLEG